MKRELILGVFIILLTSFISAEIIINQQPNEVYNLGDTISIPVTIKAQSDISGSFQMNLLCNGRDINFYKNGIKLFYGEEEKLTPSLVLSKDIIGEVIGTCKIKSSLIGQEPQLTNEFKISDLITIEIKSEVNEFNPGESIYLEGYTTKENNKDVSGFIALKIITPDGEEINHLETINNGFFSANISLQEDAKAGEYNIQLNAYERNFLGETINKGVMDYTVFVIQIPTSLEIVFDTQDVEPGTNLKVKAVLHDQTGEKIVSDSTITIKNENNLILEQTQKQTDEFLEFPILYNQPPAEWTVTVESNKLTNEATFQIIEKKEVKVEIINKTLIITNVGNIFYNDSILVKIENESLSVDVALEIDKIQKYILNAPDGKYSVEILADGESYISENVMLTGKSIDIKKAKQGVITLVRYPFVWIFIIGIFAFVSFMILKKGYKRSFFGYIHPKRKQERKLVPLRKKSLINTTSRAELSLSLQGDKQNTTVVCLKIKNLKDIEKKKGNVEETLQKIVNVAEDYKAAVYENQNNIFFILAPIKTRTFKNEKPAIELAQKIIETLNHHNKLFKHKIDFGISLNNGSIVAKKEGDAIKFMSMGTLITTAKKIATFSDQKIHLSEKIKEKLMSGIKTEKHKKDNVTFYTITEIKNKDEHKKFIRSFLDRMEGKK